MKTGALFTDTKKTCLEKGTRFHFATIFLMMMMMVMDDDDDGDRLARQAHGRESGTHEEW